jgi:hypothetical protein
MTRANIARRAFVTVLLLAAVAVGYRVLKHDVHPATATSPAIPPSTAPAAPKTQPAAQTHQGFLYGRITTADGATYQGLLRWGSDQEAFWSDSFSGVKHGNSWLPYVPPGRLPKERHPIRLLGIEIVQREKPIDVRRLLVARFGEIVRIEARGREVRVTLKSGTVVVLDRFEASDFDDGVRVWDAKRGVVDLDSLRIRTIEFLPTPPLGTAPYRLQGTVRTRRGDFTGFIQWDWEKCVGSDQLHGRAGMGKRSLRFDTLRSIARLSRASSRVTLLDGREMVLSGTADVSDGNRGIYVDDPRYGRVMVSWDAFERADFSPGASGPAYGDFPPGRPLTGSVTTRAGRHLAGRLVYDLDESETTETLDASSQGVDYSIPFGLIASVVPSGREERGVQHGRVTLQSGEELQLERTGDLGKGNAGLLIFANGNQHPEYVRWTEVARVDLDRPPAMYPPLGGR